MHQIKSVDDLRWLLGHTGGFRGGYVTDVQMSKRRLYDERSGREVLTDTTVTVVVRYSVRQMARVAKLTMAGVTDFSVFEQEGADCSALSVIQAECTGGKLRSYTSCAMKRSWKKWRLLCSTTGSMNSPCGGRFRALLRIGPRSNGCWLN
jgi:hypothetical protein